jgi:hypothetical protein
MIKKFYKIWEIDHNRFVSSNYSETHDILDFAEFTKHASKNIDNELNYFYIEGTNCYDRNGQMIFEGDILEFEKQYYNFKYKDKQCYEVVTPNESNTAFILRDIDKFNKILENNNIMPNDTPLVPILSNQYSKVVGNIFTDLHELSNYDL